MDYKTPCVMSRKIFSENCVAFLRQQREVKILLLSQSRAYVYFDTITGITAIRLTGLRKTCSVKSPQVKETCLLKPSLLY